MSNSIHHVGIPPEGWESWESHVVHFHDFESMPADKGYKVRSPPFSCFNRKWRVRLYPGGNKNSSDGKVSIYLTKDGGPEISAKYHILIRGASGCIMDDSKRVGTAMMIMEKSSEYQIFTDGKNSSWGCGIFVKRAEITDPSKKILKNGTLTVEVRIKPDEDHYCRNFIPKNDFSQNMLKSFMDEDTADISFEVNIPDGSSSSVLFHAHKVVLHFCAKGSTLSSLCESCDKLTPVPITGLDPEVFRQMLYYIYGGSILAAEWKSRSKDFIDVADKFGVKNLKIEAEAWYVKHLEITLDNVVDTLHYAHDKNCFLLKEAATNFILKHGKEVLASDSFENIPNSASIMREIVSIATTKLKDPDDPTTLTINELRAMLYAKGKDIDGPRKRLIDQLSPKQKNNNKKARASV